MIKLYKFGPGFGLRETGPFVLKTMAYMRLVGIPFEDHIQTDPRKAPKGKIPYIEDDGEQIGDSTFILKHLKSKFGDPLADGLSEEQLAIGQTVKVMLEERTYWAGMIYPRWVKTDHHKLIAHKLFSEIPSLIRMPIFRMITKSVVKSAQGHGITNHTDDEIFELGVDDIKTVESILGEKNFMLGTKPAEVDATVYAFLHGLSTQVFPTPIQAYIRNSETLMRYVERMDALVFAEAA